MRLVQLPMRIQDTSDVDTLIVMMADSSHNNHSTRRVAVVRVHSYWMLKWDFEVVMFSYLAAGRHLAFQVGFPC